MGDSRLVPLLLATLLIATVAGVFVLSPPATGGEDPVRAVVRSDNPKLLDDLKASLNVKHDFGAMGFSAIVDAATLRDLQRTPGVTASQALEFTLPVLDPDTSQPAAVQENKVYARPNFTPPNILRVHADLAWEEGVDGSGVDIAFIDTGLDIEHPDLRTSVFLCVDVTTSTFSIADATARDIREGECTDYIGHGTHVAGTGAANGGEDGEGIFGVARSAGIGMAKVCPGFICLEDDIAAGILLAAERGADVLSISLGGSEPSPVIHDAIRSVVADGVVVVAAAGNSGPDPDTINYPGAFPEVVAAAATENLTDVPEDETEEYTRVTDFSSRGIDDGNDATIVEREVELAAPGRSIFSTCDGSFDTFVNGYCSASGTSMATPHVAGIMALIIDARGGAETMDDGTDVEEVRDIFQSNVGTTTFDIVEDCCDHATEGYDIASGYGMPEMDLVLDFLSVGANGGPGPGKGGPP